MVTLHLYVSNGRFPLHESTVPTPSAESIQHHRQGQLPVAEITFDAANTINTEVTYSCNTKIVCKRLPVQKFN